MPIWSVYMLRCHDGALYTGIATDVARRLDEHECGRGAKSLRGRGPLVVVFAREVDDRSLALKVEHRIKQLPKAAKERLVDGGAEFDEILSLIAEA